MNIDVLEKLLPNLLTMITQLAATGVIFIMYKKYLHIPVTKYLQARKNKREEDLLSAQVAKSEAQKLQLQSKEDYEQARKDMTKLRERMLAEALVEKEKIIASAQIEIEMLKARNAQMLESEKARLYQEVNTHLLDVASEINKKVLEDYTYSEEDMLRALQKEMVDYDYQH